MKHSRERSAFLAHPRPLHPLALAIGNNAKMCCTGNSDFDGNLEQSRNCDATRREWT